MRKTLSLSGLGERVGWRARAACFQAEAAKAKSQGGVRAGQEPSLSGTPVLGHLSMHRAPIREKQQPAPRLTLRDLQNKSSCSSPSSGAGGPFHTASPEPPGPPQQPLQTELSLANITVPLESIKPSE